MLQWKKCRIVLTVITGIFALNLFLSACSQETLTGIHDVEVINSKIREIPKGYNFVGANWYEDNAANFDLFSNPEHVEEYIKAIKYLGTDLLRYPSGNCVYTNFWDVPYEDIYKAIGAKYWRAGFKLTLEEFLAFCKKGGFKATIQLNTHNYFDKAKKEIILLKSHDLTPEGKKDWDTGEVKWKLVKKAAEYAADEVRWVKKNNFYDLVAYWEIGNEEYLRENRRTGYTGSEYAKVAKIFTEELRKVDPNIKLLLTTSTNTVNPMQVGKPKYFSPQYMYNWNKSLFDSPEINDIKKNIFAITIHLYPYGRFWPLDDYNVFRKSIYNNDKLDTNYLLNTHKAFIDKYGYDKVSIFINEFNATDCDSCKYSNTWLVALGNARMIMTSAKNPNCHHLDYHELMNFNYRVTYIENGKTKYKDDVYNGRGYGLLHYAKNFTVPFIYHPVGNAVAMLNQAIKGNVLKTVYNENYPLYVLSSEDEKSVRVIFLNMEKNTQINLKLSGFDNLRYIDNKSLGIGVAEDFTALDVYDSITTPSQVRQINEIENEIQINHSGDKYRINLPANTLSVFNFEKI